MHFSKITLAAFAAQVLSVSAQYYPSSSIYARDAEFDDDFSYGLYAREAEPEAEAEDDLIEHLYARAAEAEAERDALLEHIYIRDLQRRVELPGGNPVSRIANTLQYGAKAATAYSQAQQHKAHTSQPSFHQRTGGKFITKPITHKPAGKR